MLDICAVTANKMVEIVLELRTIMLKFQLYRIAADVYLAEATVAAAAAAAKKQ